MNQIHEPRNRNQRTRGITILDLNGRITMGEEAGKFRQIVQDLAKRGPSPKLILDMCQVDYIDSTGLGAIVMSATSFRKPGEVKLLKLEPAQYRAPGSHQVDHHLRSVRRRAGRGEQLLPGREIKQFDILEFVKARSRLDAAAGDRAWRPV